MDPFKFALLRRSKEKNNLSSTRRDSNPWLLYHCATTTAHLDLKNMILRVTLDSPYSLSHSYIQSKKLRYDEDVSYLSGQLFWLTCHLIEQSLGRRKLLRAAESWWQHLSGFRCPEKWIQTTSVTKPVHPIKIKIKWASKLYLGIC